MKDLEGLELEGDRVLEVGGLEVLTVSREDWTNLQPHLRFPLPVLALREQRNTPGPNISLKYVGRGAVGWRCYINNVRLSNIHCRCSTFIIKKVIQRLGEDDVNN